MPARATAPVAYGGDFYRSISRQATSSFSHSNDSTSSLPEKALRSGRQPMPGLKISSPHTFIISSFNIPLIDRSSSRRGAPPRRSASSRLPPAVTPTSRAFHRRRRRVAMNILNDFASLYRRRHMREQASAPMDIRRRLNFRAAPLGRHFEC